MDFFKMEVKHTASRSKKSKKGILKLVERESYFDGEIL